MRSSVWKFQVNRKKVHWIRFVLEACDGIATVTTTDRRRGVIAVHVPPGCEADTWAVLRSIAAETMLTPYGLTV